MPSLFGGLRRLRLLVGQDWLARRQRLVEPASWGMDRCRLEALVTGLGAFRYRAHRHDELVEARLRLGFRRLDQHRAVHDQREIHGHRMEALGDQRLGEVYGAYAPFKPAIRKKRLVLATAAIPERRAER